jgi:hypothetical protein
MVCYQCAHLVYYNTLASEIFDLKYSDQTSG